MRVFGIVVIAAIVLVVLLVVYVASNGLISHTPPVSHG